MNPVKSSAGSADLMDLCITQIQSAESAAIYISERRRTPLPPFSQGRREGWKEGVGRDSQTSEMWCGTLVAVGAQRRYIYSWLKGQRRFRLPGHIRWQGCATEHWQKELHWFDWNQANRSENREVFQKKNVFIYRQLSKSNKLIKSITINTSWKSYFCQMNMNLSLF